MLQASTATQQIWHMMSSHSSDSSWNVGFSCLQELELRFVYVSKPMIGCWLEDLTGETQQQQQQQQQLL
jgi:hypothetical protein